MNGQLPGFGSSKESEESITELEKTTEQSINELEKTTEKSIDEVEKTTEVEITNQGSITTQDSADDLEVTTEMSKAEDNLEFGDNNPDTNDVTSNVWADPDVEVFTTEIFNAQTVQDSTTDDDQALEVTTDGSPTESPTTSQKEEITTTNIPEIAPVVAEIEDIVTDVEDGVWNNPEGSNGEAGLLPDIQAVIAEEEEVKLEEVCDENDDTMEEPMVIDAENIVDSEVDEAEEVTEVDSEVEDEVESVRADEEEVDSEVDQGGFDSTADFSGSDVEEIEAMEDSDEDLEEEVSEEKITRPNVSIRFSH